MCHISSTPGSYLYPIYRCKRASVQADKFVNVKRSGKAWYIPLGGKNLVCKKSQVPTKEQEERQEKSDKLSVTNYQVLNRYFQIDFILTTNLECWHCYLLLKNVSILI